MKTERELFEEWAKERGLTRTRCEDTGVYFNQKTLYAWEAWQASASRKGYKLVPVEPTEEMIKAMKNGNDEGKHATWRYRCRLQYKAMIGAAP